MIKRKRIINDHPYPDHWIVSLEYMVGKKRLAPGVFFSNSDEPGARFAFIRYVVNTHTGTGWIDCVGGTERTAGAKEICRQPCPLRDRTRQIRRTQNPEALARHPASAAHHRLRATDRPVRHQQWRAGHTGFGARAAGIHRANEIITHRAVA